MTWRWNWRWRPSDLFSEADRELFAVQGADTVTGRNYAFADALAVVASSMAIDDAIATPTVDKELARLFAMADKMSEAAQFDFWSRTKPRMAELYHAVNAPPKEKYRWRLAIHLGDVFVRHNIPVKRTDGSQFETVAPVLLKYLNPPSHIGVKHLTEKVQAAIAKEGGFYS